MAVIQSNFTCDLQKPVKVQYLDGNLFSQDNQANQFNIAVVDGGEAATITGSVSADVIRADGGTVAVTGGTISGNVASISFPSAVYAIPGVVSIVVKLTASSVVTTICAVVANVYKSSTETAVDPGTIIPSITTLISAIEAAVASIPADYSSLWTSLAPAFSSSASYTAGQYVTYNGGLYRFNTAHSGSWVAGDVTAVNLGGEVSSLKSALTEVNSTFSRIEHPADNIVTELVYTQGGYYKNDGAFVVNADWGYTDLIPCVAGKTYYLNVADTQYILFYDSNKDRINGYAATYKKAPTGSAYIRISVHKNKQPIVRLTVDGEYTSKFDAVNTAISGLEDDISDLEDDIESIETYDTENDKRLTPYLNMIDMFELANGTTVTYDGTEIVGKASDIASLISSSNPIVPKLPIVAGKRYTLSFDAYTEGNTSTSGNGLRAVFKYTNGETTATDYISNGTSTWASVSKTTFNQSDYVLSGIYFAYGTGGNNIWHIREIMLVEGEKAHDYIPYLIPKDNDARDRLDLIEDAIPLFWETDIASKIETIKTNMGTSGIFGDSFVFITDMHWRQNYKYSPKLISQIVKRTNVRFIVNGGDNLTIKTSKSAAIDEGLELVHALMKSGARLYNTFGNHDANYRIVEGQTDTTVHLDYGDVYASQFAEMEFSDVHYINPGVDFSYYFDHENAKTRYVDLDTGEAGADDPVLMNGFRSLAQVYDVLIDTPQGWNIVVIAHILMNNSDLTNLFKMLDANNAKESVTLGGTTYNLTGAKGTVKICIGGHHHKNYNWSTTGGIPCVVRDCDAYTSNYGTGEGGDVNISENDTTGQSFDVVTIDYANGKAKFVHIGTRCDSLSVDLYGASS